LRQNVKCAGIAIAAGTRQELTLRRLCVTLGREELMPELPEVETVVRGLARQLHGRTIIRVRCHAPRLRHPLRARDFAPVRGRRIMAVRRRAKYIIVEFAGRWTLVLHLGMTGSFRFVPAGARRDKHDHIDWLLDDGRCLRYNDPRRFGSAAAELLSVAGGDPPSLAALGPEPLGSALTADYLRQRAAGRITAVKAFIMDQRVVVGVGNIYAAEALFRARIRPTRAAGTVTMREWRRLVTEIRRVLAMAIRAGGTTISDYVAPDGSEGKFNVRLKVYGRAGRPCPACGAVIRQQVIGGRSSFFCPKCQH